MRRTKRSKPRKPQAPRAWLASLQRGGRTQPGTENIPIVRPTELFRKLEAAIKKHKAEQPNNE